MADLKLKDLRYLVAVADTRHFGRAAERTFVSQPTLSAQLKKLEEYLGVQLIERAPKRVARYTCSEPSSPSTNTGCIAWSAARSISPIGASASMRCVDATQTINRCCANCPTVEPTNHSEARHECSNNAETWSRRRQKSVPTTLRLAP